MLSFQDQGKLADHLEVDVKTINRLVNGKTSLSVEMAAMLGAAFGMSAGFWLNLQIANDLWAIENSMINVKLPKKISA